MDSVLFCLTEAGRSLLWQNWEELHIVFQISSAETHVFNEITALIISYLDRSPSSLDDILNYISKSMGLHPEDLDRDGFTKSLERLIELGLVTELF